MISDFQVGEEKMRIERPGGTNSPVWSMAWNPSKYVAPELRKYSSVVKGWLENTLYI